MKKALTVAAVTLAASMAFATVGALQGSSQGSSDISGGSYDAIRNSLVLVVNTSGQIALSTSGALTAGSTELTNGSVFVIQNPSLASQESVGNAAAASKWVLTTTGHVLVMSGDTSLATIQDPVGESKRALNASDEGMTVTIDASGRVLKASGGVMNDVSGQPLQTVMKGSGQLYTVSAGSVVVAFGKVKASAVSTYDKTKASAVSTVNASKTAASKTYAYIRAVGQASVATYKVSAGSVSGAVLDLYNGSRDAFRAGRDTFRHYHK